MISFIKRYLYVITGVVCVAAIGGLYLWQRQKPALTLTPAVTLYDAGAEASPPPVTIMKVYIAGQVAQPGVYEAAEGARVEDVLRLAGGTTAEADLLQVNLAAYVSDAQRVIIPAVGEEPPADLPGEEASGLVNINTASSAQLQELPGIGPVIAQSIIDYRESRGGFASIEEITNVNRIGQATYEKIKDKISV